LNKKEKKGTRVPLEVTRLIIMVKNIFYMLLDILNRIEGHFILRQDLCPSITCE